MKYCVILFFSLLTSVAIAQNMTISKMDSIIHQLTDSIRGGEGVWEIGIEGRQMLIITDQNYNRMRIISPIQEIKNLPPEEYRKALSANFHSALDAKYAISDGILWSTFIHRLKELSADQFIDAIQQVYNAAETFGTTYNSTDLQFPTEDSIHKEEDRVNQRPKTTKKI